MGYAENSKAYRLLDLDSNVIIKSRDVEFLELNFLGDTNVNPWAIQKVLILISPRCQFEF